MKLKITQTKSTIACLKKQIATMEALGLHYGMKTAWEALLAQDAQ